MTNCLVFVVWPGLVSPRHDIRSAFDSQRHVASKAMGAPSPGSVCHTRLARNQLCPSTTEYYLALPPGTRATKRGGAEANDGTRLACLSSRSGQKGRLKERQAANWFGHHVWRSIIPTRDNVILASRDIVSSLSIVALRRIAPSSKTSSHPFC
ncbi:hypothetical protein LZ32DRAFT_427367 [Colletotrichum eremochloae]|nr:hypothetical protein LZ32DRAFT_427367 [Colletotrichum eremochloae]